MPRANRYFIPGHVWHITHRCHKQEFLLKFSKDRDCWRGWLFEAKKRFGLRVLNYMATSNHIHLLVIDNGKEAIPKSMQLIAGRTGQDYNRRKGRKGAYWEDRYHATAIERGEHLMRCLVYIDLNMVRAGVVKHPSEWEAGGYNEIQSPPERYSIIDRRGLMDCCDIKDPAQLKREYRQWVGEALKGNGNGREKDWTESIAIGSRDFVDDTHEALGLRASARTVEEKGGKCIIREDTSPYSTHFDPEKGSLRAKNSYYWNDNVYESVC